MIIFVTGGVKSGKSRYAHNLAKNLSDNPVYVATAKIWDDEFKERVQRHQSDRGPEWENFEETHAVSSLPIDNKTVVVDCLTLWLTNFFIDHKQNIDSCLTQFKFEIDQLMEKAGTFILVSNEIGMGVHAETAIGRRFTDLQGLANQYVAQKAQKVILMVSGIPLTVKE
ncbi:bifunctional adenosylcobinamide kinase/adenosylcobinamide-phosphate guanylyltransferase [Solitalea lacus]|uniref:bifunctional adenosylcobinamide kinase/adenosylcobinamide-phosphate guanylyltransferase n=1 Tax=Solitalea lacus TaxID=2911172 RepID=UPI001EDC531B|nr:bifunctional adenosylcobinamide kinase/adenosylcobinamide-phosphate guanylyltransferase [Solitalea lacus]UKJ06286.1 bifunctional adenosylcobinamide kinase/adenosylcobinamide-phosphate guanylyltransferase [Solitalea lacus]